MPTDGLSEKTGHVPRRVDEQQNERNCVRGAFGINATTGSRKLRRRAAAFHPKLTDSGGGFWEELSVHFDRSVNSPSDRWHQGAHSSVAHLREEEEPKSFEREETSRGLCYDIDMELTNDVEIANESLHTGIVMNLPQRLSRTSELSKGFGFFAEALAVVPDHSLLMDIEPSESAGLPDSPLMALLPQPLLTEPDGNTVICEERKIKKSKEISVLEQVGETLRQKKLRSTQA